jgi:hypothetical protein
MDSTHKIVRSMKPDESKKKVFTSGYLFTILVKDKNVQMGIPVAFMICSSESTYVVAACGLRIRSCSPY